MAWGARKAAVCLLFCGLAVGVHANDASETIPNTFETAASAEPEGKVYFFEPFRADWKKNWVNSADSGFDGAWEHKGNYSAIAEDFGAMMKDANKRHAMAQALKSEIVVKDSTLVVQYEVKASAGFACDGAYLKLLQKEAVADLKKFDNTARYTIMFGPDKCGGTDKVHFILQHQNPVSKEWEEKHATNTPISSLSDQKTHLFTLILRPDNSFEILIDNASKHKGSLLTDMLPAVNPDKMIDDPEDKKPADWVDIAKIEDPEAKKPDDWDEDLPEFIPDDKATKPSGWEDNEPLQVPDPNAKKPADWDDEEDGEWEAPIVDNPKCKVGCGEWLRPQMRNPEYKGKWFPPMIDNPAYKGPWSPRKIENKNYFVDEHPHNVAPISAVGFELLTTSGGIVFDNILITDSEEGAKAFADKTWAVRAAAEKAASGEGLAASATKAVQNTVEMLGELKDDQPLVFAALAGAFFVALVGSIWLLCCSGSDSAAPKAAKPGVSKGSGKAKAAAKKTDEVVEDDEEEDDDDDITEEKPPAAAGGSSPAGAAGARKRAGSRKD